MVDIPTPEEFLGGLDFTPRDGWVAVLRVIEAIRKQERERAAKIARSPYGDAVDARGYDEPLAVGEKIARAIEADE